MSNEQYRQFNCYSVLNVSFNATPGEIKLAWRKISLKTHPDLGGSNAVQAKVNLAYEVLSDPIQRKSHDIYWKTAAKKDATGTTASQNSHHTTPEENYKPHESSRGEALSAFKERLERAIQAKKAAIWSELASRVILTTEQLQQEIGKARKIFFYSLGAALSSGLIAKYFPILWIGTIFLCYTAFSKMKGIDVQGKHLSLFGIGAEELKRHAQKLGEDQCHAEANRLDRHMVDFASTVELAMRSSSFDDSEIHVARRIAVALFLMGYAPSHYDSESRAILFTDGDERLVVRFRHRTGPAINVTYVEKLDALMQLNRAERGILFCSPGLSGNAAQYAQRIGIKWYTLESMNAWIDEILTLDYSGPSGDILENLQKLTRFLMKITPKVGQSYNRSRHRRGYRTWR